MPKHLSGKETAATAEPQLECTLGLMLLIGLALVALLPAARGHSDWLGWLPMWLVGMPGMALWSLHRFRLPLRRTMFRNQLSQSARRRPGAQARRCAMPVGKHLPRAA